MNSKSMSGIFHIAYANIGKIITAIFVKIFIYASPQSV